MEEGVRTVLTPSLRVPMMREINLENNPPRKEAVWCAGDDHLTAAADIVSGNLGEEL
jgi:hypothetical protein